MFWDTSLDCFIFHSRFSRVHSDIVNGSKIPTKREILSLSMSIFDPFGILSNFTIIAKLILQDLWLLETSWNEIVPASINERWQSWRSQIERTKLVRIPRCYSPNIQLAQGLQLHLFSDASEAAFSAVAYWRVPKADNGWDLVFVAGKARCAPLHLLSIPRLDLQGAVLVTRLMNEIRDSLPQLSIDSG